MIQLSKTIRIFINKIRKLTNQAFAIDKVHPVVIFVENRFADNMLIIVSFHIDVLVFFNVSQPSNFESLFEVFVVQVELCFDLCDNAILLLNVNDFEISKVDECNCVVGIDQLRIFLLNQKIRTIPNLLLTNRSVFWMQISTSLLGFVLI